MKRNYDYNYDPLQIDHVSTVVLKHINYYTDVMFLKRRVKELVQN